jgi:hypothetical protein
MSSLIGSLEPICITWDFSTLHSKPDKLLKLASITFNISRFDFFRVVSTLQSSAKAKTFRGLMLTDGGGCGKVAGSTGSTEFEISTKNL